MSEPKIIVKTIELTEITVSESEFHSWAKLRFEEPHGPVTILSDYGHWSYAGWRNIGDSSMALFLASLHFDYMGSKMLSGRFMVPDVDATTAHIKRTILEARRSREITSDQARKDWDLIQNAEPEEYFWFGHTEIDREFQRPAPSWAMFWERLWVPLIQPQLRLLAEKAA